MKNQITWVDLTVTNLDRVITDNSAVLGGQIEIAKEPAQDFVFDLPHTHFV